MDLNSLRTRVFEKTGIRIDTNDPIFALVALNEAVLSECVEQHIAGMQNTADQIKQQTAQLIEAGERAKKLLLQLGQTVDEPTPAPAQIAQEKIELSSAGKFGLPWPWIGAIAASSTLSALLVLVGQVALRPAALPRSAQIATPALSPEQALLIQNGEKYAKFWPKLDPQTQEKLRQLSQ